MDVKLTDEQPLIRCAARECCGAGFDHMTWALSALVHS
jgi:hypothetical protein